MYSANRFFIVVSIQTFVSIYNAMFSMKRIRTTHANATNTSTCSQSHSCQHTMYLSRVTPVHGLFRCFADFNRKSRMA
jgi:hypothetical protein